MQTVFPARSDIAITDDSLWKRVKESTAHVHDCIQHLVSAPSLLSNCEHLDAAMNDNFAMI